MNVEKARSSMVEQQVRTWNVLDEKVLHQLSHLPREAFVPKAMAALAFSDINIPIGHGQVMLKPREEGRLVQALKLQPTDRVLEIGTGSGFVTAMLAGLAEQVYSVDIEAAFSQMAQDRLNELELSNVQFTVGDAAEGWSAEGPFDAILVSASMPVLIEAFRKNLTLGGRLVCVVGQAPAMLAKVYTRTAEAEWAEVDLFETVIPSLKGAVQPEAFCF